MKYVLAFLIALCLTGFAVAQYGGGGAVFNQTTTIDGCGQIQYGDRHLQLQSIDRNLQFLNKEAVLRFVQNLRGLRIAKIAKFDAGFFGVQNVSGVVQITDKFGNVFLTDSFGNVQFVGTVNSDFGKRLVKQNVQDLLRLERLRGQRIFKLY